MIRPRKRDEACLAVVTLIIEAPIPGGELMVMVAPWWVPSPRVPRGLSTRRRDWEVSFYIKVFMVPDDCLNSNYRSEREDEREWLVVINPSKKDPVSLMITKVVAVIIPK